ncbi:MAG: hypothetical protein LUC41_02315 [Clostridiales bacterium]|nr:hypothetical protein [Clostridiales bacterium]
MAKKRKSSSHKHKKSTKCPEPFNTMIDIAGGLTMAAIASSMEKKHHYSERGKVNPYAVSAVGIGTGRMKTTNDVIRTGAMLGAMGAFDLDDATHVDDDDPLFSVDSFEHKGNNQYAWRMNCEDGSEYGISPEDYETRDDYNEALYMAKYSWREECEDGSGYGFTPEDYETEDDYEEALESAKLQEESGEIRYYRSEDCSLRKGDTVKLTPLTGKGVRI